MKSTAACYDELREYLSTVPLIDCHDHSRALIPKYVDPAQVVVSGYFTSDMKSASSDAEVEAMLNFDTPLEERWPLIEKVWKRTCHTGYAQVTKRLLKKFYGEDEVTLESMKRIGGKMLDLTDKKTFEGILDEANIVARLIDCHSIPMAEVLDGSYEMTPRGLLVIPLPGYHSISSYQDVQNMLKPTGKSITSLDEYIAGCREIFEGLKKWGAVAFKDQSAYRRTLAYDNPTRHEAEAVFNWFMEDPRRNASRPDGIKPLDDFLFHEFMRMARDMDLPVQIHTGHMAGIRNDIAKTNAVLLTRVLELHCDVRFDLFHANWPYSGELLYLGKNYPNVAIDFCWANIIDPIYCIEMFKQAISSVPHGKIHGYGSDFGGQVDRAWAHAEIARDNIAIALSELVEMEWLNLDEAKEVAYGWLFGNPNEFFRLGLEG